MIEFNYYFNSDSPKQTNEPLESLDNVSAYTRKTDDLPEKFFLLTYGGKIYDPFDKNINRKNPWKMKAVNEETFNTFKRYLKHRRKTYLLQAERMI